MDKKRIEELRKIYECKDPSKKVVLVKGKKINESKKLNESYGADVIEDLVDRAEGWYGDDHNLEEAVERAIDDGLIYTEDILTLLDYYGGGSEASRLFFDNYYDELYNDLYEKLKERVGDDTDESLNESEDKLNLDDYADDDNEDRDVWDVVYDEIFGVGGKDTNFYRSQEEGESDTSVPEDDHKFFDFKNSEKKFSFLDDNDAIGVHEPADIERVKKIADKYGVKYKEGKSGKSIIILIPKNLLNKPAIKYMKDRGLKTIRRFRDIAKEQAKK